MSTLTRPPVRDAAPLGAPAPPTRKPALRLGELLRVRAFAIPLLVVFAFLFAYPLAQSLYWSFTDFGVTATR